MPHRVAKKVPDVANHLKIMQNSFVCSSAALYHYPSEFHEEPKSLSQGWYRKMLPSVTKTAQLLKHIDLVDGKLVSTSNGDLVIVDDCIRQKMHNFKSLVRVFIGSPSVQLKLNEGLKFNIFNESGQREPMTLNSLTKVASLLNISAQQRKLVRLTICPQVTQHLIWTGALEEILKGLKQEISILSRQKCPTKGTNMGYQIVQNCQKLLAQSALSSDPYSSSWMQPMLAKAGSGASPKWEDVLDMFNDLVKYLEDEKPLLYHVSKLEAMKEGLLQIRDVLVDNSIGFREVRHQEILVKKKLTKALGHSSRCLFTLLLYYLYGRVRDIEVDLSGGLYEMPNESQKSFCLSFGRILTSDDEIIVRRGVKQLDRALGLVKFIWEIAGIKDVLELQGHLWSVGAQERRLAYRGKSFFIHDISL